MIEYVVRWRTIGRTIKHGWSVVEATSFIEAESIVQQKICLELKTDRIVVTDISIKA